MFGKEKKDSVNEKDAEQQNEATESAESQTEATAQAENAEPQNATEADGGEGKADEAAAKENADTPEAKIAALEKENADLKDQLLRRAADFDNYRKRMMQEKQDAFDYGNANLLKDLLDSLDNFDRTLEAASTATDVKSIVDGIKMVNKNLVNMLENKYNLSSFGKEGDEFDPDIHEAIGMQEGKVKKEQLAAVYLKGYKLKDKVIRHAKVMVTKPQA